MRLVSWTVLAATWLTLLQEGCCTKAYGVGQRKEHHSREASRSQHAAVVVDVKGQKLLKTKHAKPGHEKLTDEKPTDEKPIDEKSSHDEREEVGKHSRRKPGHHTMLPDDGDKGHPSKSLHEEAERLGAKAAKEAKAAATAAAAAAGIDVPPTMTDNVTSATAHLTNKRIDEVMRVQLDGKNDTAALQLGILVALSLCAVMLLVFRFFRSNMPSLYIHREAERQASQEQSAADASSSIMQGRALETSWLSKVLQLDAQEVIDCAGLDSWCHLQFQKLALKLIAHLSPVMMILLPLHWSNASAREMDLLSKLGLSTTEDRAIVTWAHVAVVWFVVIVTTKLLNQEQAEFLSLRHSWLTDMPRAQATTLLVEGVPDAHSSDERLRDYYAGLFEKGSIVNSYIVRKTALLWSKLSRLEGAQWLLETAEKAAGNDSTAERGGAAPRPSLVQRRETVDLRKEQLAEVEQEVAAERSRLQRASESFDPDICANSGFVTFRTRKEMRLALGQQLATDVSLLVQKPAPDPEDIIYSSLTAPAGSARISFGYWLVFGLFLAFAPLVVFVSGMLSLDTLQRQLPRLAAWRLSLPRAVDTMLERFVATLGLNVLTAALPSMLLIIVKLCFRPVTNQEAQLWIQQLYFVFLMVFVVLVTAMSQGLIETLVFVAGTPTAILPLLARTLPLASHFYMGYLVLGWVGCAVELLRPYHLLEFWKNRAFLSPENARVKAESRRGKMGPRVSQSVIMLVIMLVFCSICPEIMIFSAIYFCCEYVTHGYLCFFAEPKESDLGGTFWVCGLKHVHIGLVVYVLLMIGVLTSRGLLPAIAVSPTLYYIYSAWQLFGQHVWESLPLQVVLDLDEKDASIPAESCEANPYKQEECYASPSQDRRRRSAGQLPSSAGALAYTVARESVDLLNRRPKSSVGSEGKSSSSPEADSVSAAASGSGGTGDS